MARRLVEVAHLEFGVPPAEESSSPQIRVPAESVWRSLLVAEQSRVKILSPWVVTSSPAKVLVAVVLRREAETPPVKVEVAEPETLRGVPALRAPVVVAFVPVAFPKVKFWRVVEAET